MRRFFGKMLKCLPKPPNALKLTPEELKTGGLIDQIISEVEENWQHASDNDRSKDNNSLKGTFANLKQSLLENIRRHSEI